MKTKYEKEVEKGKENIIGGIVFPFLIIIIGLDSMGIVNLGIAGNSKGIGQGILAFIVAIVLFVYFMIIRRKYGSFIKFIMTKRGR